MDVRTDSRTSMGPETFFVLLYPLRRGRRLTSGRSTIHTIPVSYTHLEDKTVTIGTGRFGPYVYHNSKYVSLPKTYDPLEVTLDEAIELIPVSYTHLDVYKRQVLHRLLPLSFPPSAPLRPHQPAVPYHSLVRPHHLPALHCPLCTVLYLSLIHI